MSNTRPPRWPALAPHILPAAPAPTTSTSKWPSVADAARIALVIGTTGGLGDSAEGIAACPRGLRTEEFAHPIEPVLRARIVRAWILRIDGLELAQQFLLSRRELDRRLDRDVTIEIAVSSTAHPLD